MNYTNVSVPQIYPPLPPPPSGNWGSFNTTYVPPPTYRIPKRKTNQTNNVDSNYPNQYQSMVGVNYANNYQPNGGGGYDVAQQPPIPNNQVTNYNNERFTRNTQPNQQYQANNNHQYNNSNGSGFDQQQNSGYQSMPNNSNYQQNQSNFKGAGGGSWQNKPKSKNKNFKKQSGSWVSGGAAPGNENNQSNFSTQQAAPGNYVPFRKFKEHFSNRQTYNADVDLPSPDLFMGRDVTYPPALNDLMNPFFCGICNSRLNSIKSANIHYESRAHDKQITNWLKKTYVDNGFTAPVLKRFVTEEVVGPYRCELCKLDLTSAQHALQHNNGKRHKSAAAKISPPVGIGYYDADGKWVQTGKIMDKNGKEASYIMVNTPTGTEPVILHSAPTPLAAIKRAAELQASKNKEVPAKKSNLNQPLSNVVYQVAPPPSASAPAPASAPALAPAPASALAPEPAPAPLNNTQCKTLIVDFKDCSDNGQTPQDALNTQQCKLCKISTTSYDQMLLHLKGIRHSKKLRSIGAPPITEWLANPTTTILQSLDSNGPDDLSIYRTPSGSYYCKYCNSAQPDIARIKKHISSKNHLMEVKKAESPLIMS